MLQSEELHTTFLGVFPKIVYKKGSTVSNKLINIKSNLMNNTQLYFLDIQNIQILTELLHINSIT